MTAVIYGLIVLFATALGATTGAGGGAIIKPVFDLIGIDNATTIGIYSTIAVFSMCLSSLYKHSKSGQGFDKTIMLLLAVGSLIGGYLGDKVFKAATQSISNSKVTMTQAILLFFVLLAVLLFTQCKDRLPKFQVRNKLAIFGFGLAVGTLSVFLGIGGGPLNIIVLLGLMSMTAKESTPYSIGMIFFAQIPKILLILFATPAETFDLATVPVIAVTAVVGGYLGTRINHHLSEKQVTLIYGLMMAGLLITCGINIVTNVS
ncbi:sulfite exporter TauE/SafE family protein [Streptococcus caprae]|uniref:Probable membrane transporter protein n=1 Tax=Streptococcus caprae TaxID=1640501 RepID=A0ABV8CY83_9STRE